MKNVFLLSEKVIDCDFFFLLSKKFTIAAFVSNVYRLVTMLYCHVTLMIVEYAPRGYSIKSNGCHVI